MTAASTSSVVRPAADRPPSWRTVLWRTLVVTVVTTLGLWLLAAILPGFSIDSFWDALLAGFVVGIANAVVWPALAFLVVPLSVLTLGLGAIILNALFVFLLLDLLPGGRDRRVLDGVVGGRRPGDRHHVGRARCSPSTTTRGSTNGWPGRPVGGRRTPIVTDVPGVVFIQLDGVAHAVLRRALRSGDVPTLHRWIRDGSHVLVALGDRVVVADRRQPVRHPARVDRRHAGVPLDRQDDRRGDGVQPSEVRGGDREGPLRRQRPARPPRLELRQPVLRRRRARRADDERRRPAQGGPHRSRLLRLLLAARARR